MRPTRSELLALRAYADAMSATAKSQLPRIYLGNGIWWTPSRSYMDNLTRRRARAKAGDKP